MGWNDKPGRRAVQRHWFGVPLSRVAPSAYIWLAYSVFFFFEPLFRRDLRYWLQCLAIFAVFVAMYVALDIVEVIAAKLGILIGFVVLGMATFPFNPGASTFFLYAACILPFLVRSEPLVAQLIGVDFLLLVSEGALLHYPLATYGIAAFFLLFGGFSNMWMARQKWLHSRLAMAQEENIQLAAVAERERIARDLHDVLGHTLSVIVLKAELAGRLMDRDPVRAAAEIADVETTARAALTEVREAIGGYRTKGFAAEIALARRTLDAAGVSLIYAEPAGRKTLDATEETVLSLAVREAVTNIVRHAEATECEITLMEADGYHVLEVKDNGQKMVRREGNGLRGMRERVEAMRGRFRIASEAGAKLTVELPLAGHWRAGSNHASPAETAARPLPALVSE